MIKKMYKIYISFLFFQFLFIVVLKAQDCGNFYPLITGTSYELESTSANNRKEIITYTIISVSQTPDSTIAVVNNRITDTNQVLITESNFNILCRNDSVFIDVNSFFDTTTMLMDNNYDIIVKGKPISYPLVLNIAQALDDANVQVFIKYKGTIPNIVIYSLFIFNRVVVQQENITTPAGNFNTYKINSNLLLEINNNDNVTTYNMTKEEWYSSGNGIVKSLTFDGNGVLSNEKILCDVQ